MTGLALGANRQSRGRPGYRSPKEAKLPDEAHWLGFARIAKSDVCWVVNPVRKAFPFPRGSLVIPGTAAIRRHPAGRTPVKDSFT